MRFLLPVVLMLTLLACGPDYLYEAERPVQSTTWTYADSLAFNFTITDTTGIYNLFLDVTHSPDYAYENLYTRILTAFPGGQKLDQTLSLELADNTGRWAGDCGGDRCITRIPLQENAFFDAAGQYVITVHQHMRKAALPGVMAIGLAVEQTERKR